MVHRLEGSHRRSIEALEKEQDEQVGWCDATYDILSAVSFHSKPFGDICNDLTVVCSQKHGCSSSKGVEESMLYPTLNVRASHPLHDNIRTIITLLTWEAKSTG